MMMIVMIGQKVYGLRHRNRDKKFSVTLDQNQALFTPLNKQLSVANKKT